MKQIFIFRTLSPRKLINKKPKGRHIIQSGKENTFEELQSLFVELGQENFAEEFRDIFYPN
jgi:hypothetical protein